MSLAGARIWPGGARREGGVSLVCGSCTEREKASVDAATGVVGLQGREREPANGQHPEALSTEAALAGGPARSSREAAACWGGGGAKGPADPECPIDQPRPWSREEAREHAKDRRQAVCDPQADGLGGVAAGQGQQGRGRGGRAGSRELRGRSWEQSLQDLEPDELGVVLSASGQGGRDPQAAR